jgi:hypothetical protein
MNNNSKVDFKLTIEFTGNYPEQKIKELMHKVADALYHEYSHGNGFAPEEEDDCMTEGIKLKFNDIHLVDSYYVSQGGKTGLRQKNILDFSE